MAALVAGVAAGSGVLANYWLNGDEGLTATAHAAGSASKEGAVAQLWAAPVTTADGKPGSLSVLKGRPIVVNFWASWCGPCVEEMPALSQLQRDYAKKGIQFVGLGVDSEKTCRLSCKK